MKNENKSKILIIIAMVIWGTIGIFRRYIPLSSGMIALARGVLGCIFLCAVMVPSKKKFDWKNIKENLLILLLSGAIMGANWILLFEAYEYTSVATATLCYYMEPVFVMLVSPIFLKEKLSVKKVVCILISLVGMILVSGILNTTSFKISEFKGVFLGLGAAVLYATVVILNKKIKPIAAYDKTVMQLLSASIVILPYVLLVENIKDISLEPVNVVMLILVGLIHTGIAYTLYFGSMSNVKAQTVAIFSYIDPVVAIILSALILKEKMGLAEIIGAVLILGATLVCELNFSKNVRKR